MARRYPPPACRRLYRDAADADLDSVLEQVAYEITEAYADVVRLRQTMTSLQGTIARQEKVEANVARRVEAASRRPNWI
jgi:outer membrane protein TolC